MRVCRGVGGEAGGAVVGVGGGAGGAGGEGAVVGCGADAEASAGCDVRGGRGADASAEADDFVAGGLSGFCSYFFFSTFVCIWGEEGGEITYPTQTGYLVGPQPERRVHRSE